MWREDGGKLSVGHVRYVSPRTLPHRWDSALGRLPNAHSVKKETARAYRQADKIGFVLLWHGAVDVGRDRLGFPDPRRASLEKKSADFVTLAASAEQGGGRQTVNHSGEPGLTIPNEVQT